MWRVLRYVKYLQSYHDLLISSKPVVNTQNICHKLSISPKLVVQRAMQDLGSV